MATQGYQGAGGREQFVNRRYRVVRQLGVGGMGAVYLVEDTLDENQLLALKTIRTGAGSSFAFSAFRREFRAMTQFHHPNVVEVYDFGNLNANEDFFTMEVIEGRNLLDATSGAPLHEIYDYAIQIGRALEYIHSQGFIHFDLKPDNIMVRHGGTVKVMDFGLVEDVRAIQQGTVKGSVHYIAPEMVRGARIDHRFDLYSLGAVLFHVFAGRPLYEGTATQVMHQHLHAEPDYDRDVRRPFPPALRALLDRLLAKDPDDRFASASDFLAALARVAGVPEVSVSTARERSQTWVLASRFVGREAELGHLRAAFAQRVDAVVRGAPPLQLLAGPAGIGRSRLALELRHYAQLRGVRFAHGSSLEEGGMPALPFIEVLRALVREILPSETGEELSTFRDALRVPFVPGGDGAAKSATRPTMPADGAATVAATPMVQARADDPLRETVARTMVVTPEARRPAHAAPSSSLQILTAPDSGCEGELQGDEVPLAERGARHHAQLLDVLRPAAAALSRLLPDEPALRALGGEPTRFTDARAERAWLIDRICGFLVDAARIRPLVLYLSDLHWADDLTLELLERLARDLARSGHEPLDDESAPAGIGALGPSRFLLLGCFRDDETGGDGALRRALGEWTRARLAEVTTLAPMGPGELTQVLLSMIGPVSLDVSLSQRLLAQTAGNPFLIEATVRELLERGAVRRQGATFAIDPDAIDEDPSTRTMAQVLDRVLDRMLDHLDPRERTTLELLAVWNRPASAISLQLAAPDLDSLPRVLATLRRKRLLQRSWAEGHYQYRLRHSQLRAHIYRRLSAEALRRLHESVGGVVEVRHGTSELYYEDMALHFQRAGLPDKALRYARAAADAARRLHDLRRASSLYLTAWDALGSLPPGALGTLPARTEAELAIEIAEVTNQTPSPSNVDRLQRAAQVAARLSDGVLEGRVQNRLGRACFYRGRFESAAEHLARAAVLLRRAAASDTAILEDVSHALVLGGAALCFLGRFDEGLSTIDDGVAAARDAGHAARAAVGTVYRGICCVQRGRWEEARRALDEGLALCARTGEAVGMGTGASFRGVVAFAEGDLAGAERLARHGRDIIARTGGTWTFTMVGTHLAEALRARGDLDAAQLAVDETFKVMDGGERWGESGLHVTVGRLHEARGDAAPARAAFDRAIAVAVAQKGLPLEGKARLGLGLHLQRAGDQRAGGASLDEAFAIFERCGMSWYAEQARRARRGLGATQWP